MRRPTLYHYDTFLCHFCTFCRKSDFYRLGFPWWLLTFSQNPIFAFLRKNRTKVLARVSASNQNPLNGKNIGSGTQQSRKLALQIAFEVRFSGKADSSARSRFFPIKAVFLHSRSANRLVTHALILVYGWFWGASACGARPSTIIARFCALLAVFAEKAISTGLDLRHQF